MNKNLINEVKRIKELSSIKEEKKILNEGGTVDTLISDITKLFEIASDELKNSEVFKKLEDFLSNLKKDGLSIFSSSSTDSYGKIKGVSSSDDDFYKQILEGINAPVTDENLLFLYGWRQSEHTEAKNNPFATTKSGFSGTKYKNNPAGVKEYPTKEDGINATVATLKNGHYDCIVDGLKNDIGAKKISQKCDSDLKTWGTHASTDLITQVLSGWEKTGLQKPPAINT